MAERWVGRLLVHLFFAFFAIFSPHLLMFPHIQDQLWRKQGIAFQSQTMAYTICHSTRARRHVLPWYLVYS